MLLLGLSHSFYAIAADIRLDSNLRLTCASLDTKGNYYLADEKNTLYKIDQNGKEITRVNTKLYGSVYSIDCSNPFEIYVHYKDQNKVVFFDNMLNQRGELDLSSFGYGTVSAVARSFDNQIWLFDASQFELMKVSKSGEIQSRSGLLTAFVSKGLSPYAIKESGNNVYLADSLSGLIVFDMFATYRKTIPLIGSSAFDVQGPVILLSIKNKVLLYNMRSFETRELNSSIKSELISVNLHPKKYSFALVNQIIEIPIL